MTGSKLAFSALASVVLMAADATVQTSQTQALMTPSAALERLKQGNERFSRGKHQSRNLRAQLKQTRDGQYPFATVLSCIDSRSSPELLFDQGIGDIFGVRIAGNIATDEILGSLEFASKVAGSRLILVLGHTRCGAVKGAVDDVKLGYIESLVRQIKPAVDTARAKSPAAQDLVDQVAEANVNNVVDLIHNRSAILSEMLSKDEISVVGAMFDLGTGKVTFYDHVKAR